MALHLTRRRHRAEAARRAWLVQAMAYPAVPWPNDSDAPNHVGNSNLPGHQQKVPPASDRFKEMVAERAMAANPPQAGARCRQ